MEKADTQVHDFVSFSLAKEKEVVEWMKKEYFPKNHELIKKVEKEHEKFVINREGEEMPDDYVEGYLGAAKYTYDRESYKIYRPLIEEAERVYEGQL